MARTFNSNPRGRRGGGWAPSPYTFLYVLLVILCLVLATVWRTPLSNVFWSAMAPVQHARVAFDASDNARLRATLASTTALVADRNVLYQENLDLKKRLGRDANISVILGAVLMRSPQTPYDTLIVDAGTAEGVVEGDLVSAGGTTLIGVVGQVSAHVSRVVLFSAPGETYDVLLRGSLPVQMQGQGGGSFVGQVPAGTALAVGDTLVFPGIASGFAGVVSSVESHPGQSFETLYARLPVDPLGLRYVEIQKK